MEAGRRDGEVSTEDGGKKMAGDRSEWWEEWQIERIRKQAKRGGVHFPNR